MGVEFRREVGCGRYKRTEKRKDQHNGYYHRALMTLYGWLNAVKVPRLKRGGWESEVLGRYCRRSEASDRLILEGFLLGHSTRKTARQFKRAYGGSISPQGVSNVVKALNHEVEAFHRRDLGDDYRFVYLDGLWLKITSPVKTRKVLLVAYGIRHDGERELIDFMLATSESEARWWGFLSDLKTRGLRENLLEVMIHDGDGGLIKALAGLYPRVKTQLCVFHKLSNLSQNLENHRFRSRISKDAAAIYRAKTEKKLRERLSCFKARWRDREPEAVRSFIRGFDQTLTYLEYPEGIRSQIKTNNPLERYLEELQRRIRPFRKFLNAKSVDRIIYGLAPYVLDTRENEKDQPILHD